MSRRIPPMNSLRAFEATARLGTLARAADELCVTPSAIGHQVRGLEEWLGTPLYEGSGRARRLTRDGRRLAAEISQSLDQMDRACNAVQRATRPAELRLSVTPTFAIRWLVPRLGRFQAECPDISVHIAIGFGEIDFRREDIDVGLRFGDGRWPGAAAERLFDEDVFPVCSPRLMRGRRALKSPSTLQHFTLLHTSPRRDDWGRWLDAAGVAREDVDPSDGLVFELTTMAIDAAVAGLGVAITREMQVMEALQAGTLVAPFRRDLLRGEGCYLLTTPERRNDPRINAFRVWLQAEAGRPS